MVMVPLELVQKAAMHVTQRYWAGVRFLGVALRSARLAFLG